MYCVYTIIYHLQGWSILSQPVTSPDQKSGGHNNFSLLVSSQRYNIHACMGPLSIYKKKHFSTDFRKSHEGSEQKWGLLTHPAPIVATPLISTTLTGIYRLNKLNIHRKTNNVIYLNSIPTFLLKLCFKWTWTDHHETCWFLSFCRKIPFSLSLSLSLSSLSLSFCRNIPFFIQTRSPTLVQLLFKPTRLSLSPDDLKSQQLSPNFIPYNFISKI